MSQTLGDAPYTTPLTPVDHQHPEYQPATEKGQAGGYAALDASTKVPIGQLPTGATGATVAVGNHPHAEYQPVSQKGQANGYAGLDAAGKVPAAQLPTQGSVPTTVRVTGAVDPTFAVTTLADVPGLAVPLAVNAEVGFSFILAYSSAATATGIRVALNGPAGVAALLAVAEIQTTATALVVQTHTAYQQGTATTTVDTANAERLVRITGRVRNGPTAGTLTVQAATSKANSAVTVKRGSFGWYA